MNTIFLTLLGKLLLKARSLKIFLYLLGAIEVLFMIWLFMQIKVGKHHMRCYTEPQENITCHFLETPEGGLEAFEGLVDTEDEPTSERTQRSSKNIFFHETSCRGALTLRQACSVEAAARANPHWSIYVLIAAPVTKEAKEEMLIDGCPNVIYRRVLIKEYTNGTPMAEVVRAKLNRNYCKFVQANDILRYTTLYKYPGVYLDLDMIVVKSLDKLGTNFAVRESASLVSPGVLGLGDDEVGRGIAKEALESIALRIGYNMVYNGSRLITRVLNKFCNTTSVHEMNEKCKGFKVHHPEVSFPISANNFRLYFDPGQIDPIDVSDKDNTYMYHLYHQSTRCLESTKGSIFHNLAMWYCPSVYNTNREHFMGSKGNPEFVGNADNPE